MIRWKLTSLDKIQATFLSLACAGILTLFLVVILGVCASPPDNSSPEKVMMYPREIVAVLGNSNGGTIAVNDGRSPLLGLKIFVKPETLAAEQETISATCEDHLPFPFSPSARSAGTTQASKVFALSRSGESDLLSPAEITIPYDKRLVTPKDIPIVLVWTADGRNYSAASIKSIDRAAGAVTFLSVHFARFVVAVVKRRPSTK